MEEIQERKEEIKDRVIKKRENAFVQSTEVSNIDLNCLKHKIGSVHEAHDFLIDNEYITEGYRINFNSVDKVAKSLFILHNESVNIWSHLLGSILVLLLVAYTSFYIKAHKSELLGSFHLNLTHIKEEINHVTNPVIDILPNLHNMTSGIGEKYERSKEILLRISEGIVSKTVQYAGMVDKKIGIYQGYMNCYHCIEDVIQTLRDLKDNIGVHINEYTQAVVKESKNIMESIEDSAVIQYFEDFNSKLSNLKDKLTDLIDSHEMSWIGMEQGGEKAERLTRWPLFVMLVSAIICLGCSTIFHWFSAHSKETHDLLSRLDYAGISILIAGSCYPPYYYFFYCESLLRVLYLTFISTFAISVFLYSFKPDFNTPSKRRLRGSLFLTLGLSTAFPILHLAIFPYTVRGYDASPQLIYWYLGGVSYVTGAVIYILRIPERFRPGKHDYFGHSHQIFHLFVLLGVCFHYMGSLDSYYYRVNNSCPI